MTSPTPNAPHNSAPHSTVAIESIRTAFARRGHEGYGEGVSQLGHALQCAAFAQRDGASPQLICAALLHDMGHLLHNLPHDVADSGLDTRHEDAGANWLAQFYNPSVTDPVRLHVAAKRYLAATEPGYFEKLTAASVLSLRLQGGPMDEAQARAFEREPYFADAVRLRRWDEEGKLIDYQAPPLSHFEPLLSQCVAPR